MPGYFRLIESVSSQGFSVTTFLSKYLAAAVIVSCPLIVGVPQVYLIKPIKPVWRGNN